MNKKIIIGLVVIIVVAGGAWMLMRNADQSLYQPSGYPEASAPQQPSAGGEAQTLPAGQSADQSGAPTAAVGAAAFKEFTVTGQNFSYAPSMLAVKKGDTVKIIFKNTGGTHDFRIDEFNAATKRIGSGEQDTITFVADKAGSFEYYCSVGSHRQMGMKGTLTVTE